MDSVASHLDARPSLTVYRCDDPSFPRRRSLHRVQSAEKGFIAPTSHLYSTEALSSATESTHHHSLINGKRTNIHKPRKSNPHTRFPSPSMTRKASIHDANLRLDPKANTMERRIRTTSEITKTLSQEQKRFSRPWTMHSRLSKTKPCISQVEVIPNSVA